MKDRMVTKLVAHLRKLLPTVRMQAQVALDHGVKSGEQAVMA
jgi:hypothetical protein